MKKGLIGKKLGMSQIFADDGRRIPVTVIQAGPCVVTQKKTAGKDGYDALQLGFDELEAGRLSRAELGHLKSAGKGGFRTLREFRIDSVDAYSVGDVVGVDQFAEGEFVDVVGTSKGKGFQGVIKRWGFKGGRASHGSRFHRAPGSIGASAWPSRVFKNMGMPGQMGNEQVTVQRLQVVRVDAKRNLLLIKGAVPGAKNGVVVVKDSVKTVK
jgi:large subunit ribosomal protein L3